MDGDRQQQAASNRELMPEIARVVDRFRRVFGAGCLVRYAREGALERGAKPEWPAARTMDADQWLRYVKTGEVPEGKEGAL